MCLKYWLEGLIKVTIDEVMPMNLFRDGLAKIVNR